ncbi:hypothetical protein P389DRAFT_90035 [Cystobasidium minutum MCA 4210]|uniref:uncharacterized protein n=1 Tax=Cystobasidium minutum MCA 4210 TaxID=1397322 RepID=UPI0034CDFA69|eukprot:jgi/Rhomi1/90035/CE90034_173
MSTNRLPSNNAPNAGPVRMKPSTPAAASLSSILKRVALFGLVIVGLWWIYVWRSGIVQDFFDPHDKVQKHRPEFRYVEPYSDKHKYRPAASPIITAKDKLGRTKYKGKYTP